MTEKDTIAQILDRSTVDAPKSTDLAELSELDRDEIETFKQAWSPLGPERRRHIISRLVELAEDNVELNFNEIFKLALRDLDEEVRVKAIAGLWEDEETALIRPLLDLLHKDSSERVRAAAASAFERFTLLGEHGKLRPAQVDKIKESLLGVFNDRTANEEIRRRALESLSPLSITEVKKAIALAYGQGTERMRVGAIYAMGRSCDSDWLPILLKETSNSDAERRFEAATALGELGDPDAVPRLMELGNDTDSEVRMAALQSLGKIGGSKAREYLQSCMNTRDEAVKDAARHALDELKANEDPLSAPF